MFSNIYDTPVAVSELTEANGNETAVHIELRRRIKRLCEDTNLYPLFILLSVNMQQLLYLNETARRISVRISTGPPTQAKQLGQLSDWLDQ
jgi:hypothetical protein